MADALSVKIDDLITGADALSAAADSIATITSGSDVVVSNFDHVEEVFDNLQDFLAELKAGSWYAPVGLVSPFAGATAPAGWLLCNGDSVPNGAGTVQGKASNYAELYALLGSAYGSAGKLPDLRGRTIIGDGTAASGATLTGVRGIVQGAATKALSTGELPSHTHSISGSGTTSGAGGHSHTVAIQREVIGRGSGTSTFGKYDDGGAIGTSGVGDHSHTWSFSGTSGGTGSGTAFSLAQPSMGLNYIIKA